MSGNLSPFDPGFPPHPPVPVDGCGVCASYVESIHDRKRAGDESGAGDYRVLMARHHDVEHD